MAALVDPNLGIFVHDPLILIAAAGAVLVALTRRPSRLSDMRHLVTLAVAVLFAVAFTQTGNFNSGGTPGPSRYGLWLLPLAIPVIASSASTMWVRGLAVASILWCSAHFAPAAPESYLHPTALAERLWDRNPEVDNPLAEVFAERVSGQEPPPKPPIATTGCEKVLVAGDGMRVGWPSRCDAIVPNAPSECRENGALCYANKLLTTYTFKRAPASPSWIVWQQTPGVMETSVQAPAQQAGLAVPPAQRPQPTLWLTDGWSYLEHDIGAPRDAATWRWMGDRAQLDVVMPAAGRARVRLVLRAFTKTRRLRISLGGKAVATLPITEGLHGYQTEPIDFAAGSNALVFESLDGSEMPGPKDTRRLSIALYHADVEP
jgi:hypothetical protein